MLNRSNSVQPLVSIILLVWNGEKYICSCAKSIAEQGYNNIEVIVVDNASIDGSIEIIKSNNCA